MNASNRLQPPIPFFRQCKIRKHRSIGQVMFADIMVQSSEPLWFESQNHQHVIPFMSFIFTLLAGFPNLLLPTLFGWIMWLALLGLIVFL